MKTAARGAARVAIIAVCCLGSATALGDAHLPGPAGNDSTAPDFDRTDLTGQRIHLDDYRGSLVLINFWATWCGPCREEMPAFSSWQRTYASRGLKVIGISMDDDEGTTRQFLKQHPVTYPIVMGDPALAGRFGGVLGLPISFLIDPSGHVIARYRGSDQLAQMSAQIKKRLTSRPASST